MTKLRKIHQAAVEFLIALAQRMQHSQIERSEFSDPSIDLGMIISQLAGLGAEMQMNFPFLVPENGSGPPNKDPFALKLVRLPQPHYLVLTCFIDKSSKTTQKTKTKTRYFGTDFASSKGSRIANKTRYTKRSYDR